MLTPRRITAALLVALSALVLTGVTAVPVAAQTDPCPNRTAPPPPVDTSENPKPGEPSAAPVPVPQQAAGGPRMSECGVVAPDGSTPPAEVTSASWLLADMDTGQVLGAKDPHARHRPASLIKVLLAIVVLDELDLDKVVTGTQEDANQDGTRVGIGPGGQYTVRQLLFALLMRSGNDAAHALARQFGTVPEALAKMNAKARVLGALDTQAATPSGLDGPGMMTSAFDMGLLYREAMKRPGFAEAIKTRQIDFPGYGGRAGYKVGNDNRLLGSYPGFFGGKTGFTDDARHTYVGGAGQNGHRLVVVLLRSEQQPVRITDQATRLLDWGFGLYRGKVDAVGNLQETGKPAGQGGDQGAPGDSGASDDSRGGGSGEAGAGARQDDDSGPLPVFAMSISGLTLLAFFIWRIRRRQTTHLLPQPRPDDPPASGIGDPEATVRVHRIWDTPQ